MPNDKDNSTMLFILSGIQESIRAVEAKIDDRWDKAITELTSQGERLDHLEEEVAHNTKILTTGNGKPSIVTQIFKLQSDLDEMRGTCRDTLHEIAEVKKALAPQVPEKVRVERWKTAGLVIGFLGTIASTLAAIFT